MPNRVEIDDEDEIDGAKDESEEAQNARMLADLLSYMQGRKGLDLEPSEADLKQLSNADMAGELASGYVELVSQYRELIGLIENHEEYVHRSPELYEILKLIELEICVLVLIFRQKISCITTLTVAKTLFKLRKQFGNLIEDIELCESSPQDTMHDEDNLDGEEVLD